MFDNKKVIALQNQNKFLRKELAKERNDLVTAREVISDLKVNLKHESEEIGDLQQDIEILKGYTKIQDIYSAKLRVILRLAKLYIPDSGKHEDEFVKEKIEEVLNL